MSEQNPGVVDYDAMLVAISLIETMMTGDAEQQQMILETFDKDHLIHGLTTVGVALLEFSRLQVRAERAEMIKRFRDLALQKSMGA